MTLPAKKYSQMNQSDQKNLQTVLTSFNPHKLSSLTGTQLAPECKM